MARKALPILEKPFVDATICGPCGGECCRYYPGIASPEDFGAPDVDVMRSRLNEALTSGRWAVDWWEGDPRPYDERGDDGADDYRSSSEFIRPAMKGHEGQLSHAGWSGPCTFFTEGKGCALEHDARPRNCRGLIPMVGASCAEKDVSKVDYVRAWEPYLDLIASVLSEVRRAA